MDEHTRAVLDSLLNKRVEDLTQDEIDFLKARRDYIKRSQLEDYINIFNQTPKGTTKKVNATR